MPDPNTVAFPYPLMRCIPSGRGPEGIPGNVRFVSTSAAPNGRFFTVRDVVGAIADSINVTLRLEGWASGPLCDIQRKHLRGITRTRVDPQGVGVTDWDLTPPARDPVLAEVMRRAKTLAFSMGLHPRLGAKAGMRVLDPEILRRICDAAAPGVIAPEMDAEAARAVARHPVLLAEAEAMRAKIPIFRTTWGTGIA
mmetsp:Transcript_37878/g.89534  ORF Transcript_37878/g.89534 Transcript_37878/m.89534 type:complete len:196 (+) Transcript_37878:221-808(+)